jgi:hypothetical protein
MRSAEDFVSFLSRTWRPPSSKVARAKIAATVVAGLAVVAIAVFYLTRGDGLTDSSSCSDWLNATRVEQADYVNGWADLVDYKTYGPEFTSLCKSSLETAGAANLGEIAQEVVSGHG